MKQKCVETGPLHVPALNGVFGFGDVVDHPDLIVGFEPVDDNGSGKPPAKKRAPRAKKKVEPKPETAPEPEHVVAEVDEKPTDPTE